MAHQTLASAWLYSNKSAFNIHFFEKSWPKKYDLPYFDFEVVGFFSGEKRIGRGVDSAREVALEKACAEILENVICLENKVSSLGASLTSYQGFESHALNEAFERYYLDQHLELKIPLLQQHTIKNYLGHSVLNSRIEFYKLNTAKDSHGILCKISDNQKSVSSYGFSYSKDLDKSLEKAFVEAIPNFLFLHESNGNENSLPWQLTPQFSSQIDALLFESLPEKFVCASIPDSIFKMTVLKNPVFLEKLDFPFKLIKFTR